MNHIYLSRRNLLTLLNKLARTGSARTIIKNDTVHPEYPCTTVTMVTAVADEDYYDGRAAGVVHPADLP